MGAKDYGPQVLPYVSLAAVVDCTPTGTEGARGLTVARGAGCAGGISALRAGLTDLGAKGYGPQVLPRVSVAAFVDSTPTGRKGRPAGYL